MALRSDAPDDPGDPLPTLSSRMRIAVVTEYYYPHLGGVCEHVHFFAREARRRGHHVDIITSRIPGAEPAPNVIRLGRSVPVYANGSMARVTIGRNLRRQVRETLRLGRYDIVHVHTPLAPTLPLLALEESNVPVIGTFHTNFGRSFGYELSRRFFQRRLDRLAAAICVSPTAARANDRYFEADWTIIPNGIDTSEFHPAAPRPAAIHPEIPTILFLGRFDPRNGLATLFDAFRKVRGRRRPARLVVVGDGPLTNHYHRLAAGDPDIVFVGSVLAGRADYYANSTIYACPTTKASFGITLLESMACATPIVCSDIEGFKDVVEDGREALMTPCGDVSSLADALVRLLEDDVLRARLGSAGRERSLDFSWSSVTDQVLDVYEKTLGVTIAVA